jgi:hypothetical protein
VSTTERARQSVSPRRAACFSGANFIAILFLPRCAAPRDEKGLADGEKNFGAKENSFLDFILGWTTKALRQLPSFS